MSMRKPIAPHERAQVNVLGVAASGALGAPLVIPAGKEGPDLGKVLSKAASRALPSGAAGGVAMGLNILCLMWMRTTVNYQYRYGSGTITAIKALYKEGGSTPAGITRFYRGLVPALFQGPLSRFGDTAANTGTLVILNEYDSTKDLPAYAKTAFCSVSAASWRLFLMPIDTLKTTLQTDGAKGMALLRTKMASGGPPRALQRRRGRRHGQHRRLLPLGFAASAVSDCSSNSIRVLKVYKQTNADTTMTYTKAIKEIVAKDGVWGLFGRGLGTKLISNGIQGAMFSVLWKTIEPMLFPK
ncbi:mitochondrial carrier protein [Aureococcus anophagefferens]|nr:mitochondrial carrier protein [Aureococcus anophagefferens]